MATWQVKLLYDGGCPFCGREVQWLKQRDGPGHLALEDISAPSFDPSPYGLSHDEVFATLHAVLPDGRIVRGVDAVAAAYRAVGLGWVVAITRPRVLHAVFDGVYRLFARNRIRLGLLFGGQCREHTCRSESSHG